jgi:hypothetical protein
MYCTKYVLLTGYFFVLLTEKKGMNGLKIEK